MTPNQVAITKRFAVSNLFYGTPDNLTAEEFYDTLFVTKYPQELIENFIADEYSHYTTQDVLNELEYHYARLAEYHEAMNKA